ncbi:MAG: ribose-phosphate diphosphokinase [Bacilli bacterium]|nr:ribose-phosphate diphosphokinase [Bacilli bacterium]
MKEQLEKERLRLIVFKSALELGQKVDEHLLDMYRFDKDKYTFIVPINENYFDDGHLKVEINSTVRGKDVFFLTDIGNYSITYTMRGFTNHTSPNDLMQQLKDGIGATNRHADKINIIMPLLYAGRQHRRNTRENLACGESLRELDRIHGIKSFITFDAHDQGVEHATENMEFENFFATNTILDEFINNTPKEDLRNIVFVAPDSGAVGRRNVYLNSFDSEFIDRDAGEFYKQRDYKHLVNGKYKVIAHKYIGNNDLNGKTAIVIDDMISSGGSMLNVINELHDCGATKIYVMITFALFTRGIEDFKKMYAEGKLAGIYTTNLTYIPEEYKKESWLHICDCSKEIAQIIYNMHNDLSITGILKDKSEPIMLLEKKFGKQKDNKKGYDFDESIIQFH